MSTPLMLPQRWIAGRAQHLVGSTLLLALVVASGCRPPPYRLPRPDEPHAIVKIRRVYHVRDGTRLRETAYIGQATIEDRNLDSRRSAPRTHAVRIHPVPDRWSIGGTFFHHETRTVSESYTVQVPQTTYRTETYTCGYSSYGSYSSARTCTRSVPVTTYRSETRWRTVTRTVAVTDIQCGRRFGLAPRTGAVYLLQFSLLESGICNVACFRQTAGDQMQDAPCTRKEFAPPGV